MEPRNCEEHRTRTERQHTRTEGGFQGDNPRRCYEIYTFLRVDFAKLMRLLGASKIELLACRAAPLLHLPSYSYS